MPRTVRFRQLVDQAGKPEIHLRFGPPEKDPELKRAVKEQRVLTLHREVRGQKKPYGTVGLHADGHAQILVFPSSLAAFSGRQVIGIDFDLIADEKLSSRPDAPDEGWKPRKRKRAAPEEKERQAAPSVKESGSSKTGRKALRSPGRPADIDDLLREVRSAVRELKAGKAVAAYERLEKLI